LKDEPSHINLIIEACRQGNRSGQHKLYKLFFAYAMSIALRYTANKAEAEDVLNESFLKAFTKLDQYDEDYAFKYWLRKIIIHTAIDHQRKHNKLNISPNEMVLPSSSDNNEGWENLLYEDVLEQVQRLPPAYRLVFNLYAVEGYKHHEIAEKLNISVGASKSNYAKARQLLQKKLKQKNNLEQNYRHGRQL
jgi:RNA polymerase sigma-70 factor (ECF subfamily)